MAVDEIRPDERADRAQLAHAAHELAAGQVHVVHRQHRHELQPVGAVLAELVDPVVVGLAERERELGIQIVARDEAEARRGIEHRDVDAFHLHAHHLSFGVVVALDREIQPAGVGEPRARQRLGALRRAAAGSRFRYCCSSASAVGSPSMTIIPRAAIRPAVGAHLDA